jgi:hypothetical protein
MDIGASEASRIPAFNPEAGLPSLDALGTPFRAVTGRIFEGIGAGTICAETRIPRSDWFRVADTVTVIDHTRFPRRYIAEVS